MKEWLNKHPEEKSSLLGAALILVVSLAVRCYMADRLKDIPPRIVESALREASLPALRWLCLLPLPFWFWSRYEYRNRTEQNSKPWLLPGVLCALSIIGSVYIFVFLLPDGCFALCYGSNGGWPARKVLLQTFGLPGLMDTLLYCLTALFLRPEGNQKNIP